MALLHHAELSPTKLELLAAWLPGRAWFAGQADDIVRVAGFRFDDPAGEVGVETILVRAGDGPVFQVPLTYRGAPLDDARSLVGTMMHSVLGERWVYDACGDPVYLAALAGAMLGGERQADEFFEVDGRLEKREPSMTITASGGDLGTPTTTPIIGSIQQITDADPTVIVTDTVELTVMRRLDGGTPATGAAQLSGIWPGRQTPTPLASIAMR